MRLFRNIHSRCLPHKGNDKSVVSLSDPWTTVQWPHPLYPRQVNGGHLVDTHSTTNHPQGAIATIPRARHNLQYIHCTCRRIIYCTLNAGNCTCTGIHIYTFGFHDPVSPQQAGNKSRYYKGNAMQLNLINRWTRTSYKVSSLGNETTKDTVIKNEYIHVRKCK